MGKTTRQRARWLLLVSQAILLLLLACPLSAQASGAKQALEEVSRFSNLTQCCITRARYLKVYRETTKKIQGLLRSAPAGHLSAQAKAVEAVWQNYKDVAHILEHYAGRPICQDSQLAQIKSAYPSAGRDFDQGGAMMPSPQGKKCMAPQLLVPIMLRRAAKALKQAQEFIGRPSPQK